MAKNKHELKKERDMKLRELEKSIVFNNSEDEFDFKLPQAKDSCKNKRYHTMHGWMTDRIYDADLSDEIQDAMQEVNDIYLIRNLENCKDCALCKWYTDTTKNNLVRPTWRSCPNHDQEYFDDFGECDCEDAIFVRRKTLIDWTIDRIFE